MNTPYYTYKHVRENWFLSLATLLLLPMTIAGCSSDSDSFSPGAEPKTGGQSVFFAGDFSNTYISYGDGIPDTIRLVRTYNDADSLKLRAQELTVNLIVEEADTAIHMQKDVTFEAGKDTAYLSIIAPSLEINDEVKFSISIPEEYANPYQKKNGSTKLISSILRGTWEVLADTVIFQTNEKYLPYMGCKLENLGKKNRFRFTNFMNTGVPLEFSLKTTGVFNSKDLTKNKGEIIPLTQYQYSGDYWYFKNNEWNLLNPAIQWDDNWTDEQKEAWEKDERTISYISFYCAQDGYNYIDLELGDNAKNIKWGDKTFTYDYDHYGMMCSWIDYKNQASAWQYFYIYVGYKKE